MYVRSPIVKYDSNFKVKGLINWTSFFQCKLNTYKIKSLNCIVEHLSNYFLKLQLLK